jgi:hypothetical protein
MRRAAVSISSNIAEGSSRPSRPDFARLIEIATGSVFEVPSREHVLPAPLSCHSRVLPVQRPWQEDGPMATPQVLLVRQSHPLQVLPQGRDQALGQWSSA